MELDVYWLELAENKLEDIYGYYSIKVNKRVAKKIVNEIVDAIEGIEKQPEIGQVEIILKQHNQIFQALAFSRVIDFSKNAVKMQMHNKNASSKMI